MQFYVSKTNNKLNGKPFTPELITRNICLNPMYKVNVARNTRVLLDSGAFQDVKDNTRLTFNDALQRQLDFEDDIGVTSELLVSYDRLVDEKHDESVGRIKKRVSYRTAEKYVDETINAAKFLVDQRKDLNPRKLVLSCQGVTTEQYLDCLKEVLEFAEPCDTIGFGGFCIVGLKPKYEKQYFETLEKGVPLMRKRGFKRLHIFGMGKFKLLVKTHLVCRKYGVEPSYDTSTYEINGIMGRMFNPYEYKLTGIFSKDEKYEAYYPTEIALLNIKTINQFWKNLDETYPMQK